MPTKKPAAKKPGAQKDKKPAAPAKKAAAPAKKAAAPAKKAPAGKKTTTAAVPATVPNPDQGEMFLPAHAVDELAGEHVITSASRVAEPVDAHVAHGGGTDDDDDDDDDDDEDLEPGVPAVPPPELTDEERELSAIYGEEAGPASAAHKEFTDGKTADEDRPLMPEINARAERKNRWEDRREQRRQRRDQRRGGGEGRNDGRPPQQQGGGGGQRPSQQQHGGHNQQAQQRLALPASAPPAPVATAPAPVTNGAPLNGAAAAAAANLFEHDALARVGTPLGDAAATVFAQLRNNQPLPVKQLAAMMRKRNLVGVEADQLWPQLKAELLGDERSYRTLGLRPRIVYRGRDLFAPGPVATSLTADAEAGMAAALSRLAGATHRALAQRVSRATGAGFERLIHAYLVAAGYRDIDWVKRVDGISYASVTAPGIERTVLISARAGDRPIDRRGIGELRVGVAAKNLVAGILFSAAGLSEEAEGELERDGRSIAVVCGDQLIATLIAAGVGVVSRTAPLHYVDDQLLDELMQG